MRTVLPFDVAAESAARTLLANECEKSASVNSHTVLFFCAEEITGTRSALRRAGLFGRFARGIGRRRNVGGFDKLFDQSLRLPLVANDDLLHSPVGIHDDSANLVIPFAAAFHDGEAELIGDGIDVDHGASDEVPFI